MNRTITIIATEGIISNLHRSLLGIDWVELSEIDDLSEIGWSLDAPFNPRRADEGLAAVTAVFDDRAHSAVIARFLAALQTAPAQHELLLRNPMTSVEIGRVKADATGEKVARLIECAPQLDGFGFVPEAELGIPAPSEKAVSSSEPAFHFRLEGEGVTGNQVPYGANVDLIFDYDVPPDDLLAEVTGKGLEWIRQRSGNLDLTIIPHGFPSVTGCGQGLRSSKKSS